ncbi:MAG: DUF6751 family protein [Bacilli bacterium]
MVLFQNADMTIYHLNKDQTYSRINIDNVNWNSKRTATVNEKGINIAYTTMIVADMGDNKITTDDKIVKGNINLDITRLSELKDYELVTVVGVQYNDIFGSYSIECK